MVRKAFKTAKNITGQLWKDESAQGATEYILLLVVVVGIAMMFRGKIKTMVNDRLNALEGGMSTFKPEGD